MLPQFSKKRNAYLTKIAGYINENISTPINILRKLLEEYNPNKKGYESPDNKVMGNKLYDNNVFLFEKDNKRHNKLLTGKLLRLLDCDSNFDHILSVIWRLNKNDSTAVGRIVDPDLIALFSAFFSVFSQYRTYLSKQLTNKFNLINIWDDFAANQNDILLKQLEKKEWYHKFYIFEALLSIDKFGHGERQDKIIDELLNDVTQDLNNFQNNQTNVYDLRQKMQILFSICQAYESKRSAIINLFLKALQVRPRSSTDFELTIGNLTSQLGQFISNEDKESVINDLTSRLSNENEDDVTNATQALYCMKAIIPESAKPKLISKLFDNLNKKFKSVSVACAGVNLLGDLRDYLTSEQKKYVIDYLLQNLATGDDPWVNPLKRQWMCKAAPSFLQFIQSEIREKLIERLISNLKTLDAEKVYPTCGLTMELCSLLIQLKSYISESNIQRIIDSVIKMLRAHSLDKESHSLSQLLLTFANAIKPNQKSKLTTIVKSLESSIYSKDFYDVNYKLQVYLDLIHTLHIDENKTEIRNFIDLLINHMSWDHEIHGLEVLFAKMTQPEKKYACNMLIDQICNYHYCDDKFFPFLKSCMASLSIDDKVALLNKFYFTSGKLSVELNFALAYLCTYESYQREIGYEILKNKNNTLHDNQWLPRDMLNTIKARI